MFTLDRTSTSLLGGTITVPINTPYGVNWGNKVLHVLDCFSNIEVLVSKSLLC